MKFMDLYYIVMPYIECAIYGFFGLVTLYCLYIVLFEKGKAVRKR